MSTQRQNTPQPADPLALLNEPGEVFKNPLQVEFIRTLLRVLREAFAQIVMRNRATAYIMLQSDSGKAYMLKVNDDGTLRTEYVRG